MAVSRSGRSDFHFDVEISKGTSDCIYRIFGSRRNFIRRCGDCLKRGGDLLRCFLAFPDSKVPIRKAKNKFLSFARKVTDGVI